MCGIHEGGSAPKGKSSSEPIPFIPDLSALESLTGPLVFLFLVSPLVDAGLLRTPWTWAYKIPGYTQLAKTESAEVP